jgi:hypothetical protein
MKNSKRFSGYFTHGFASDNKSWIDEIWLKVNKFYIDQQLFSTDLPENMLVFG